ncbi:MAG: amino acid adenylation domain-containing protein [Sulfitobacter sp.]|jgi:amino acid adenylation domain-containing protein
MTPNGTPPPAKRALKKSKVRKIIAGIWADLLGADAIADDRTFFEAGGTSLLLLRARVKMQDALGIEIAQTQLFETPRLGDLAAVLWAQLAETVATANTPLEAVEVAGPEIDDKAIAIIGYAARVPGVASTDAFWDAIQRGEDLIERFDIAELEDTLGAEAHADPAFVPARSILADVDMFDAKYFGILPAEAAQMDPQARVFLEICTQALDHAAIDPARATGPIGVYAGATHSTYLLNNIMADRAGLEAFTSGFQLENYNTYTGNVADTLATRVAFKLNLKGPAMTVSTTCSTSLTAIAQAVTALRAGQCDVALAGGVSITFPQKRGYVAKEGGMASQDGTCRPFDAEAQGTVFGHGAGVVVLKPLALARADGDRIVGLIRGVGINNDGSDKIAFTAPSVGGQVGAIKAAYLDAAVDPASISYVECHGTATPLGDPIEVRALTQAFDDVDGQGLIALGSVKGNIGHLDAGAGVVGVIKLVEMFQARQIPPIAHYKAPNPRISFADGPFFVPDGLSDWHSDGPRRAGISGFGVGGTNVHLVLEEAPEDEAISAEAAEVQILPLSAKSPEALLVAAASLADALEASDAPLSDVAFTLQQGRQSHPFRMSIAAEDSVNAAKSLRDTPKVTRRAADASPVAFLFPGQGAQFPGMCSGLYGAEPVFTEWMDRGAEALVGTLDLDFLGLLITADPDDKAAADVLRQTSIAQPALFVTSFATAQHWIAKGITPSAFVGHSVGEFAAAALAGVMSFETALHLVAKRGALMQDQPPGVMLSVRATLHEVTALLEDVDLAGANAPKLQVVSGTEDSVARLEIRLEAAGIAHRRLHTSHAFHSVMMDPIAPALMDAFAQVTLSAPNIPLVSTVTGAWMTDAEATDPAYWAGQARAPVYFAKALETLADEAEYALLEAGPGKTLSTFCAQTLKRDQHAGIISSLPGAGAPGTAAFTTAQATGALWSAGVPLDWGRATKRGQRKVVLPGPVFLKKRHWIDPVASQAAPHAALVASPSHAPELPVMSQVAPIAAPRIDRLIGEVIVLFADLSGEDLSADDLDIPFLELGFDSLFMGQAAQAIAKTFGVQMTFRSLLSEHPSLGALARHLDASMPADVTPVAPPVAAPAVAAPAVAMQVAHAITPIVASSDTSAIIQAQMQTMQAVFAQQLQALGGRSSSAPQAIAAPTPVPALAPVRTDMPKAIAAPKPSDKPAAFKFGRGPNLSGADLTPAQIVFAQDLARDYSARYSGSKSHTQTYRAAHADPRSVAGFRPELKELAFPIVAAKAKGAWIEDVDGNQLLDLVNGFGQTAFGHSPDFVSKAVAAQMETGYALGPQADRAGPVAARLCEMLGHQRVTFCNTGSEAVMAAMRLARAVTGRERIVVFSDDYHGQFDEVLVKGKARGGEPTALPIAPGIPRAAVSNMVVLDYGPDASLEWIKAHADEIAAVVVEPVQSRNPHHRPADFVRALRKITAETGSALVIDEVVTGFRTHRRGMQGVWDIQPDMATYGKVIGGGMPIGLLAGDAKFMDALDGGMWEFGDDSAPQVAPTFFAGTFVRHPLVVTAIEAVMDYLDGEGDKLWVDAAAKVEGLAGRMNAALVARGLPELVKTYSSWFVLKTTAHDPRATLLYPLMRLQGVHLLDGFCGFLTTEHTDADCDTVLGAFEVALDRLQAVGILAAEGPVSLPVPSVAASSPVPLTESQREIWMVHQLGDVPASAFNESVSLRIEGELDAAMLQTALGNVVARHDALRSRFARDGASFTVDAPDTFDLKTQDYRGTSDPEAALQELLVCDARTPVDLVDGPVMRATLVTLGAQRHVLMMTAHHIICDGWSFNTVVEDLSALYTAAVNGTDAALADAPSFAQFAQTPALITPEPDTKAYWRAVMADVPALPELPTDRARPIQRSFNGATVATTIPAERIATLKKAGGKMGATLFATLLAGVQMTLGRLSGSNQVVVCVPMGGQAHLPDQSLVGHLVNFLPIRADFDPTEPANAQVARVAKAVMDGFDHGNYTLGTLINDLDVARQLGRLPISEVQFNLERVPESIALGKATAQMKGNPKAGVNYDLFFNCVEGAEGVRIEVDYNVDLYDRSTIERWVRHLDTLLGVVAETPERAIADLPLLSAPQELSLAQSNNETGAPFDRAARIEDLVAAQVAATPDAVAVTGIDGVLSYRELAAQSDALAAQIQMQVGTKASRVGVALPRGSGLLVGLLGVLKAGHAYVPLDPGQPIARQRAVLEAASVSAVIAPADMSGVLTEGLSILAIDPLSVSAGAQPEDTDRGAQDTAYVIFTSGSTGAPKGVAVPHRAVVNFLTSMAAAPGLNAADKLLSVTTVSFDIAVLELFLPLIVGAQVEIASREDILDGFRLAKRAGEGDITVMQATPTLWAMLLEAGLTPHSGLKLLAGGEPLPQDLPARLMAHGADLWNMYGPTETTIWSTIAKLEPGAPVSIGKPIANTHMHVLDAADHLCAQGVVGELNIGGDGLAEGYFGRDDLTEAAFRMVEIAGQAHRLYRTGDLAMRRADGSLHLLGRRDGQIKLRGYRIELGEIEAQLRGDPSVANAAVALRKGPSGADQLVGYLVAGEGASIDIIATSDRLAGALPDYMVPTAWKVMADLPQTANGKLDRKALPEPNPVEAVRLRAVEAPKGGLEAQIAAIWKDVLGNDVVSVTDTLQQLGADSLDIFRIASRLMAAGLPLEARDVFAHPSIRALAEHAASAAATPERPSLQDFVRTRQTG